MVDIRLGYGVYVPHPRDQRKYTKATVVKIDGSLIKVRLLLDGRQAERWVLSQVIRAGGSNG